MDTGALLLMLDPQATEPEAAVLIAAMTVPPTAARRLLINTFIRSLKTTGVWSKLDGLWVMAAHDEQAGRLNWKNPATFTLGAVSSPTFTANAGFAGNGTSSYLTTGFNPITAGGQYSLNSASVGIRINTDVLGSTAVDIGQFSGAQNNGSFIRTKLVANLAQVRCNSGANTSNLTTVTANGLTVISRTSSTSFKFYKNGTAVNDTITDTSTALAGFPFMILALNSSGTASGFSAKEASTAFVGGGLTDTNVVDFNTALSAYFSGIGLA